MVLLAAIAIYLAIGLVLGLVMGFLINLFIDKMWTKEKIRYRGLLRILIYIGAVVLGYYVASKATGIEVE